MRRLLFPNYCNLPLFDFLSGAPLMYILLPISASISPYFFMAYKIIYSLAEQDNINRKTHAYRSYFILTAI
jgi:hypothetical protein